MVNYFCAYNYKPAVLLGPALRIFKLNKNSSQYFRNWAAYLTINKMEKNFKVQKCSTSSCNSREMFLEE